MMKSIKNILESLIDGAEQFGLGKDDLEHTKEFLNHNEPELCFDTVITQLYEFDIEINDGFYRLVSEAAKKMHIPVESYTFINQLIKK